MTTYLVDDSSGEVEVTILEDGGDHVVARIGDGQPQRWQLKTLPDGRVALFGEDGSQRLLLGEAERADDAYAVHVQDGPIGTTLGVQSERARWLGGGAAGGKGGAGAIKASMPGRVVKVTVAVGDVVQAGAVVAVLEAMKMENDVEAPGAGKVTEVAVSAGDAVDAGGTLVVLGALDEAEA